MFSAANYADDTFITQWYRIRKNASLFLIIAPIHKQIYLLKIYKIIIIKRLWI